MKVDPKIFQQELARAKVALSTGSVDGGEGHAMLQVKSPILRIGGRGVSLSYVGVVPALDVEDSLQNRRIYLPLSAVDTLLSLDKKDISLELTLEGHDLHFNAPSGQGVVTVVEGMKYWKPYGNAEGTPFMLLQDGSTLVRGIALCAEVKKGWTVKTRPYPAGFIRLQVADESAHPDLHQPDYDVCRLLLDAVTSDQDEAVGYASGLALSVFASDEARYFQAFEPVYHRPTDEKGDIIPTSTVLNAGMIGRPIHLLLSDAEALRKVLPGATLRVHALQEDKGRIKALSFFNATTFIWVEAALHVYPDEDFNEQLAYMNGEVVATFTATAAFKKTVGAIEKLASAKDHGLTFITKEGTIYVSSPEGSGQVRYGSVAAEVFYPDYLAVVSASGVKSALTKMKGEITVVAGVDFVAFYNESTSSRIVLRNYQR